MPEGEIRCAQDEYGSQIAKALALMPGEEGEANLDDHVRWELKEVLSRLTYDDLSTREVMALLAILCPVHSRVLRLRAHVGVDTCASTPLIRLLRD